MGGQAAERADVLGAIRSYLVARDVAAERIVLGAHLTNDLEIDSLDLLDLATELEDRFRIAIRAEDAIHLETIGDIVDFYAAGGARRTSELAGDRR